MRRPAAILLAAPAALLGACVPRASAPPPAPVAAPPPRVATQPRPAPPVATPQPAAPTAVSTGASAAVPVGTRSPGAWTYRREGAGRSRALFGPATGPAFLLACAGGGSIELVRAGATTGPLTFRTTSEARSVQASPGPAGLTARVGANDPLLDALAFSRGRFTVEAPGAAPLTVPTWPELARVIEDCRRR